MSYNKIKLLPTTILNVPITKFDDDFTFIVNGEKFKTNRITADLLSPKICKNHFNDPTTKIFTINTNAKGNFQDILNLINFEPKSCPESEMPFLSEIIEILGNKSIELYDENIISQMSLDDVLNLLESHEKFESFYSKSIEKEINFIATHFYKIDENQIKILEKLKIETLEKIFKNKEIRLKSEDQLLTIINKLYFQDSMYSILYEYVNFLNVSASKMREFLINYDIFDLTRELWNSLSFRLQAPLEQINDENERYFIHLFQEENKEFDGIINYLHKKYKKEIFNHINITSSGIFENDQKDFSPSRSILYDNHDFFKSKNEENSWLCFDFQNHYVILSGYSIRSPNMGENGGFLKSWVIEGSNDNENWEIVDEQINSEFLIGKRNSHTFEVKNEKKEEFRYLRLRQTGPSFNGNHLLNIESIEFFGGLLKY